MDSRELRRELNELRRENDELTEQLRRAQRLETVGLLTEGIIHDFNNLLTPILGYAQLAIAETDRTNPHHRWLSEIHEAAQLAQQLTEQLLVFGRNQSLDLRHLDLSREIQQFSQLLRRLLRDAIHLETKLTPDLGAVFGDATQFRQILLNLAINAQDAMPDGGTLTLETAGSGTGRERHVRVTVSDTGTGMAPEIRDRVFDPFFTTKGESRGTGLGLSLVRTIVQQHGGTIRVDSEPGRGTRFTIDLPIDATDQDASGPGGTDTARAGEVVLLVEDNTMVRRMTSTFLKSKGYEVLEAADGEAALHLARDADRPIHLLLTDLAMPRMTGEELYERLTTERCGLKVLYISAHKSGQPQILAKPFSREDLAHRARSALDE